MYKLLNLIIFLTIPFSLALGPCDNGRLPGDPLDPSQSTTAKAATPLPKVDLPAGEGALQGEVSQGAVEDAPEELEEAEPTPFREVFFVTLAGKKLEGVMELQLGQKLSLKVRLVPFEGPFEDVKTFYEEEALAWHSTADHVISPSVKAGVFEVTGPGTAYLWAKHPQFLAVAMVKVEH